MSRLRNGYGVDLIHKLIGETQYAWIKSGFLSRNGRKERSKRSMGFKDESCIEEARSQSSKVQQDS